MHGGFKDYKCTSCNYAAYEAKAIYRHFEVEHNKKFRYKCNFCDYCTLDRINVQRHLRRVHRKAANLFVKQVEKKPCHGKTIKKKVEKGSTLPISHILRKKIIKTFNCKSCKGRFASKALLFVHQASFHLRIRISKCIMCQYSDPLRGTSLYNQAFTITRHIMEVHKPELKYENKYYCKICSFSASVMKKVKIHYLDVHLKTPLCNKVKSTFRYTQPHGWARDGIKKKISRCTGSSEQRKEDKTRANKNCRANTKTDKNAKIDVSQEISDYERLRQRNIQERFKIFDQLQIREVKSALFGIISKDKN